MKTLAEEIITIVQSNANNNPAPERCNVVKVYDDDIHVDVQTSIGLLTYVDSIGSNPKLGDNAIVVFLDESYNDYVVLCDTESFGDTSKIIEDSALSNLGTSAGATQHDINLKIDEKINHGNSTVNGVGEFRITNGHLIVTLPKNWSNPYHIDENGHLIYKVGNNND